ncbi:MerR family transcriptional regulator [Branchiibius cervicis]|uniref:MerR family transcriptional regulator n=1 Tax=Branchiibius cervicis TaxID=908252 RepID=A0ABW2AXI6_9MICO
MQIGEFAQRTGVSARAVRHYEDQGLLQPRRDGNGYRQFDDDDLATVERIRLMISAGVSTATMRQYLDCVGIGDHGVAIEMCPALRSELDAVRHRLDRQSTRIDATRAALCALTEG